MNRWPIVGGWIAVEPIVAEDVVGGPTIQVPANFQVAKFLSVLERGKIGKII